jgi:hypothetical protein
LKFPVFYTNKMVKGSGVARKNFFRNPVEQALKVNQVGAVNRILEFLVTYQNNLLSGFLLKKVLPSLVERGISVKALFDSNCFREPFDLDEWPTNHYNDEEALRPFNGNYFLLG